MEDNKFVNIFPIIRRNSVKEYMDIVEKYNNICQSELIIPQNNLPKNWNWTELIIGGVPSVIMITILFLSAKEKERLINKARKQREYRQKYLEKEKARQLKFRLDNKEYCRQADKKYCKIYYLKNKDKIKVRKQNRKLISVGHINFIMVIIFSRPRIKNTFSLFKASNSFQLL